jgi:hypothetical protein
MQQIFFPIKYFRKSGNFRDKWKRFLCCHLINVEPLDWFWSNFVFPSYFIHFIEGIKFRIHELKI